MRRTSGWGRAPRSRRMIAEEAIGYLDGPIARVAARNVPLPYSPELDPTMPETMAAKMRIRTSGLLIETATGATRWLAAVL